MKSLLSIHSIQLSTLFFFISIFLFINASVIAQLQIDRLDVDPINAYDANYGEMVYSDGDFLVVSSPRTESVQIYKKDGDDYFFHQRIQNEEFADFGSSISIHENRMVIGGPFYNSLQGAAWVYTINDQGFWEEESMLTPDMESQTLFGNDVLIQDNSIIIGAPDYGDNIGEGAVFIFEIGEDFFWRLDEKIRPGNTEDLIGFGTQVELLGEELFVSSPEDIINNVLQGSVSIYELGNDGASVLKQKITDPNGEQFDFFGQRMIGGDVDFFVGSPFGDNSQGLPNGKISVYTKNLDQNTWEYVQSLDGSSNNGSELFGISLACKPGFLSAGALTMEQGFNSGSVINFSKNGNGSWNRNSTVLLENGLENDQFGRSCHYNNEMLIIGCPGRNLNGDNSGGAFIYNTENDTVTEEVFISPLDINVFEDFGSDCAIHGNNLICGMPFDEPNNILSGSAAIFERNEDGKFLFKQRIVPFTQIGFESFGSSVSIFGNIAVIGANAAAPNGIFNNGYVEIYELKENGNWEYLQRINAPEMQGNYYFGFDVAVEDNRLAIGAVGNMTNGELSGVVHIYDRFNGEGEFTHWQDLFPEDPAAFEQFGYQVALDNGNLLVSANTGNVNGIRSGSVYLFEPGEKTLLFQKQKIVPSSLQDNQFFGERIAFKDGKILISSTDADIGTEGIDAGKVFLYEENVNGDYEYAAEFTSNTQAPFTYFGTDLAIDNQALLIGSAFEDEKGFNDGRVYAFEKNNNDWNLKDRFGSNTSNTFENFGRSVSLQGDIAIVGAPGNITENGPGGSVFIYDLNVPAPTISCFPEGETDFLDENCELVIQDYTGMLVVEDENDPNPVITQFPEPGTIYTEGAGSLNLMFTATNSAGKSNQCEVVLEILDELPPSITCPDITGPFSRSSCTVIIPDLLGMVSVSDNCGGNPQITQDPAAGTEVPSCNSYDITINASDEFGNSQACITSISFIDTLEASFSDNIPISCFGESDGELSVGIEGGCPPYAIEWDNGEMGPIATELDAGLTQLTVTDNNGCMGVFEILVEQPDSIVVDFTVNIDSVSQIELMVSGGVPPYSYQWSDPIIENGPTVTGLAAGSYSVTVTDANGCSVIKEIDVSTTTATTDLETQNKMELFPNPTSDNLIIQALIPNDYRFSVLHVSGQYMIRDQQFSEKQILFVKDFPVGLYFIQIRDSEGNVTMKRFVKT